MTDTLFSRLDLFFSGLRRHVAQAPWALDYVAELLALRAFHQAHNRIAVVSFYMSNIARNVVAAQATAIRRFLPEGVDFLQFHTGFSHGRSIDLFFRLAPYDLVVILDVDCIPLNDQALPALIEQAEAGHLVGAAQRANHIENAKHIYAGPFLMALSKDTYVRLGRPSFCETERGDVAEELTYAAEAREVPVLLLWPTHCDEPKWQLTETLSFGRNTVYEDLFLHAFEIREPEQQRAFLGTVSRVLADPSAA